MVEVLKYTLEAGIIFWIFLFFFQNVYYSLCYNKWNRVYLLSTTFLSYLIPTMKIKYFHNRYFENDFKILDITHYCDNLDFVTISKEKNFRDYILNFFDSRLFEITVEILFAIYLSGVAVKLTAFFIGLYKTLILKKQSTLINTLDNNIKVYKTQLNVVAFSFFNNIFLGKKSDGLSNEELQTIFAHEKQHIKNKDSFDTLLFAFFSSIQWFNPAAKRATNFSKIISENIVDSGLASTKTVQEYTTLLLKLGEKNKEEQTEKKTKKKTKSALRERLILLFNSDSDKIKKIRFLSTLIILIFFLISYVLFFGMIFPEKSGLNLPIKGKYRISTDYFENKLYVDSLNEIFVITHPQIDFRISEESEIISPINGIARLLNGEIILKNNNLEITIGGEISPKEFLRKDTLIKVIQNEILSIKSQKNSLVYLKIKENGRIINPKQKFKL